MDGEHQFVADMDFNEYADRVIDIALDSSIRRGMKGVMIRMQLAFREDRRLEECEMSDDDPPWVKRDD